MKDKIKPFEFSTVMGYWVLGSTVIDVSNSTHIKYMLDHLSDFGLTEDDVKATYEKTGEKYGSEGRGRELLIKYVATNGWIRVRHYQRPREYWSIQCNNSNYQRGELKKFCKWALSKGLMQMDSEVTLLGYSNPQDAQNFTWESGGIGNYLMEQKKTI